MLTKSIPIMRYTIPVFALMMLLEALILSRSAARTADPSGDAPVPVRRRRGYSGNDMLANLALAVLSGIPGMLTDSISVVIAVAAWDHRIFSLGTGWPVWILAIVVVDFNEYWNHRASHRIRLLWANHVQHHSSTYLNVSTALRAPVTSFSGVLFFPWLSILGIQPWIIFAAFGITAAYQLWIHTEMIGKLPRWFEFVFNAPSHHRVHHGSDGQYLDKNYGTVLIVWDRIFGTFQPESEPVTYGLVHDINTNNLWKIITHEYISLLRDVRTVPGLTAKIAMFVMPPGWRPAAGRLSR